MLENLRDYPRTFIDLLFEGYSDGVIVGAQIQVEGDFLIITSGIIKHNGKMYILEKGYQVPYYATGKDCMIKILFKEESIDDDFRSCATEIALDQNMEIKHNEQELGRFKLKVGARLRLDYRDLRDFSTEYNTVNTIHVAYAGFAKSTISPALLRYFAIEMFKNNSSNPLDLIFSMQCMSQGTVDKDIILHYIANRLGIEYKEHSNGQIHKYLTLILENAKGGTTIRSGNRNAFQRVIVD